MDTSPQRSQSYQLSYPSLAQHFVNSLAIAVHTLKLTPISAPLLIHVETTPKIGGYRSAIALTLPPKDKATLAIELGAIAQTHLNAIATHSNPHQHFILTPQPTGWIDLQCTLDRQIEVINHIKQYACKISPSPVTADFSSPLNPNLIFELQYAHARCSSLLKLAQSIYPPTHLALKQAIAPWLTKYFSLYPIETSIEHQLWHRLLNFPNELHGQNKFLASLDTSPSQESSPILPTNPSMEFPLTQKRILSLSQSWVRLFQKFYSQCQLIEISQPKQQDLLALRYALFSGFKTILNFILTELSQNSAPHFL